jgi:glycosyltransferase involved in cell wall biosynthesis
MKTLTVLIPVFNEARTLPELLRQLSELPSGLYQECVFVDDGSSDNSREILVRLVAELGVPHQIISQENKGKAGAIKSGSQVLRTSHVVILDSDLELATEDIVRMWDVVQREESDFVFGYRVFLSHSSFTWRYSRGNQVISNLFGLFFNEVITDIMCGYKLVPSDFLSELPFKYRKFGLEIEIPMYMWMNRLRPYEIEVSYRARTRSEGKSISVKDAIRVIASMAVFRITHKRTLQ